VAQLIADSVQVVAPIAAEKGLPLVVDVQADLPAIRVDANQLTQVCVNLLGNALKFTAEGKVTIGARLREQFVEFFVADTGEGIFPEEQKVVFEEYFRIAENICNRPRGSGLGLSISKRIVEYHGGRIWVESEPGKGSTFRFSIPLTSEERPSPPEEGRSVVEGTSLEYGPILVLMESSPVRHALRKKLEELGFRTLGAGSPVRARELAEGMKPDVIIADVTDRWQEFMQLEQWARTAGIEMILSTLHVSPANGALNLAVNGYLCKPFDPFAIKSALKPGAALVIISPHREEARSLQVVLGTEGHATRLFADENEAVRTCRNERPDGIVIGSCPRATTENLISALKHDSKTADIALYMVLASNVGLHVRTVTVESGSRKGGAEGIYPLVKEVEKAYIKKWGKE
jgi:CheY-like chemotaxis protein